MKVVIVDLDGILADAAHRLHHLHKDRKDWRAFLIAMRMDPINPWCRALIKSMSRKGYRIAIVSGRPDDYMATAIAWLKIHDIPYDEIHLRRSGDTRDEDIVKKEIVQEHFRKEDILFIVDDRLSVVKMWRDEGFVCLECKPVAV